MDEGKLLSLILLCIPLSLLSFGGGQTIMAGLQHETVEIRHFLTSQQFTDLFAISRVAPGPSTLIVALIGWQLGGFLGAVAATLAIFIPSSALICLMGRKWQRHRGETWAVALESGLAPVAVGLVFAGALVVAQSSDLTTLNFITVGLAVVLLYFTKIGSYTLLGAVALGYFALAFYQA